MRVVSVETLRPKFQPNLCVVRLTTEDGSIGLGEAFFQAPAVDAYLHSYVAPLLFSMESVNPESAAMALVPYVGFQGGGVEQRGNGAVDFALWDLLGKATGVSVARLLGGPVRTSVRAYNTCAGSGYVGSNSGQRSANWGTEREGRFEDLHGFLTDSGALARDLLQSGITGMKIWPFDTAAERSNGTEISRTELASALRIVGGIRDAVGSDMDIMIEMHGLWNAPAAISIIRSLQPFEPFWIEDPIRPDATDGLKRIREATTATIATGETIVGRRGFRPLLDGGLVDVVTVDTQWTGGLTEARKVASMADGYGIPIAPHDCTGPISLAACTHLSLSQPNGFLQETTRAFINTWYAEVIEGGPTLERGQVTIDEAPGLGVSLVAGFDTRSDVIARATLA